MHVGYVYLDHGAFQRLYAVVQGYAGMRVGAGVERYAVVREAYFLHLVYHHALYVALEIVNFHTGESLAQLRQVVVERAVAVNARLPYAQEVEVGTVQY